MELTITTFKGLEQVLALELKELGAHAISKTCTNSRSNCGKNRCRKVLMLS